MDTESRKKKEKKRGSEILSCVDKLAKNEIIYYKGFLKSSNSVFMKTEA